MSKQLEREGFMLEMGKLGVPLSVARKVLRHAATIQRCEEAVCSYEWADRDRVPCPGVKVEGSCICDFGYDTPGKHGTVPRVARTAQRRQDNIRAILAPFGLEPRFQGDPRGYCVRILRPSDRREECYSDGIGVPA